MPKFQPTQNLLFGGRQILINAYLNSVVRICNKCNKKAENHIYKKANEGI